MKSGIYSQLCAHLNAHLIGAPETDEILEILRLKFTPEEAELALHLSPLPQDVSKIARFAIKPEEKVRYMLERMADKGLVQTVSGKPELKGMYSLLPTLPGLFECTFGKGQVDPRTKRLARLWQEYYERGFGKEIHRAKTPITRIIPIEKSVISNLEVLPYERASEILKSMSFFSVTNCACRLAAKLAGMGCDKPIDVCMHFEDFGRFLTERGYGKEITREEAQTILDKTERAGLIHLTINLQAGCFVICSCCACCCFQLRGISQLHKPGAVASSRFIPVINADECTACGVCEERCHFDAIKVVNDTAGVDKDKCIGCGLCATACPVEAISLKERETWQKPFPGIEKLVEKVFKEKAQPSN